MQRWPHLNLKTLLWCVVMIFISQVLIFQWNFLSQTLVERNPSQFKPVQISSSGNSSLNCPKLSNQGMKRPSLNQTRRANSVPIIHYQCEECGTRFACLGQWQQHSRLRLCCIPESEEKGRNEDKVKPKTSERWNEEGLETKELRLRNQRD